MIQENSMTSLHSSLDSEISEHASIATDFPFAH